MSPNTKKDVIFSELIRGAATQSGGLSEFHLRRINVHILEMEDVLFHLNSAVMMPKAPEGPSSTQGGGAQPQQSKISGIEALAVVYRQFEFDERKRLLITAHTDTSGDADFNFELSDLRAQGVLYLLDGSRESWAGISESRQKIEDYQQIMTFLCTNSHWNWDCDSKGVTDKWNNDTYDAINKFIADYNNWVLHQNPPPKGAAVLSPELADLTKKDSKHHWPIEMWRAVFDIYMESMADALKIIRQQLEKDYRPLLKFIIDRGTEYKYVACGESFPIDQSEKSNYRSQSNRRVVFLFFDQDEIPYMDCPARIKTVHTAPECPIWHKRHFLPLYINPNDLNLEQITFNIRFHDIKSDTLIDVPEGLKFKVIEDGAEVSCRTTYSGVCYNLKIHENKARKKLELSFEAPNQWVDCSDANAPKIVAKTPDEMAVMHFDERAKYYDLPAKWNSKNWMVKRNNNWVKFDDTILDMKAGAIEINLDATVLVNESQNPETVASTDRFTIFTHKILIINQDNDKGYLTTGTVDKNFFCQILNGWRPRLFAWNGNFYDSTNKRLYTGNYIGARAAVKNDPDDHYGKDIHQPTSNLAGNFDLHYLKDCLDPDSKGVDALLAYWSCKFTPDADVTPADIAKIEKSGFNNIMDRWNQKKNHFIALTDPQNRNLKVLPRFFFEHREQDSAKATALIHNPVPGARSSMGLTRTNLKTTDFFTSGASQLEDGEDYKFMTAAHEFGHAMGLLDEYRESIEEDNDWNPILPRFQQYYAGMPYGFEDVAMMNGNKIPRLKHYWYFCRWVNETDKVKLLTGNTVFGVESGLGKNRQYFLKAEMKDYCKPFLEDTDCTNGSSGRYDLHLYKCGQDESVDSMVTGQSDLDSILIIKHKLQFFFDNHGGATWQDNDARLNYMRQFQNRIDYHYNHKFYLESSTDADFKKVYLHFVPHYYFQGMTIQDHFEVEVEANNTANVRYTADYFADGFHSDEFSIDQLEDEISAMRYMLGLAPYRIVGGTKQSIGTIAAADMNFLATWLSGKRGGAAFTVKG
jgi:hypothetical protein